MNESMDDARLTSLKVVELHAIGPVPFVGMQLQQLGDSVVRVSPSRLVLATNGPLMPARQTAALPLYRTLQRACPTNTTSPTAGFNSSRFHIPARP